MGNFQQVHKRLLRTPEEPMIGENEGTEVDIDDIEVVTNDKKIKPDVPATFIRKIEQGMRPADAAKSVGSTLTGLMSNDELQKRLKMLLSTATLPPEVRKDMVRKWSNLFLIQNFNSQDPAMQKMCLEVSKFIGNDPTVGLNAPPVPGIQVNVENLQNLFTKIENDDEWNPKIVPES